MLQKTKILNQKSTTSRSRKSFPIQLFSFNLSNPFFFIPLFKSSYSVLIVFRQSAQDRFPLSSPTPSNLHEQVLFRIGQIIARSSCIFFKNGRHIVARVELRQWGSNSKATRYWFFWSLSGLCWCFDWS